MKRCISLFSSRTVAAIATTSAALLLGTSVFTSSLASAQIGDAQPAVRQFPKTALRGEMVMQNHPSLTLNGKAERLSPGARIFDQNNHLVLSGQLVGRDLMVNYVRDGGGQIHQVWLLNAEEAKEKRAGTLATIFNFITGSTPASDIATPP